MRRPDIARLRLHHQRLSAPLFTKPDQVVKWLGAVQAQDYAGAKWAIGQRMQDATDDGIEKALAEGSLLRTHALRSTWHFVAPGDIRWMLELTAPRVKTAIGSYCRKSSLDEALFKRSQKAMRAALLGGRHLSRQALRQAVQRAGMAPDNLGFIMMLLRAEVDGVICSGARIGNQFTYALLEERVPKSKALSRDEALAELARRYFTSRGPATLHDFVWWSGLAVADARAGIEMAGRRLVREPIDGTTCWLSSSTQEVSRGSRGAYLLPAYDEFLVAYKDRSAAIDPAYSKRTMNAILGPAILVSGRVAGTWKRSAEKREVVVTLSPFATLHASARRAIAGAGRRYGTFLGSAVAIV